MHASGNICRCCTVGTSCLVSLPIFPEYSSSVNISSRIVTETNHLDLLSCEEAPKAVFRTSTFVLRPQCKELICKSCREAKFTDTTMRRFSFCANNGRSGRIISSAFAFPSAVLHRARCIINRRHLLCQPGKFPGFASGVTSLTKVRTSYRRF